MRSSPGEPATNVRDKTEKTLSPLESVQQMDCGAGNATGPVTEEYRQLEPQPRRGQSGCGRRVTLPDAGTPRCGEIGRRRGTQQVDRWHRTDRVRGMLRES